MDVLSYLLFGASLALLVLSWHLSRKVKGRFLAGPPDHCVFEVSAILPNGRTVLVRKQQTIEELRAARFPDVMISANFNYLVAMATDATAKEIRSIK